MVKKIKIAHQVFVEIPQRQFLDLDCTLGRHKVSATEVLVCSCGRIFCGERIWSCSLA